MFFLVNFKPSGLTTSTVLLPTTLLPDISLISTMPLSSAVNTPSSDIVPMVSSDDFQVTSPGRFAAFPEELTPVAVKFIDVPIVK